MNRIWVIPVGAVAVLATTAVGGPQTSGRPASLHDIRPGPGVTAARLLSAYLPALAGTPGDTEVFVFEGQEAGGTAFLAGGTHANEIAGIMAAVVLVERVRVRQGRLIVVPHANNSAITWPDPRRPGPESITLRTPSGPRRFRYGARYTRADHQGQADPRTFRHSPDSEPLDGIESRNLDRAYPGRPDGTLTQRIAAAIMRLLETERVEVAFDLHEAGPESRLAWMMVAHPKNVELAASALLALDADGIDMKLERSADTFRGLSHREWGDATRARAFLFETANPAMVAGGRGGDAVNDREFPLARRVAVHLAAVSAVLEAHGIEEGKAGAVRLLDVPKVADMVRDGVGAYLR